MIDETMCNALLTHVTGASFSWQVGFDRTDVAISSRISGRRVAAPDLLRAVMLMVAELTGLLPDTELFTTIPPPDLRVGYAVAFSGSDESGEFDFPRRICRLTGRAESVSALADVQDKLESKLPLPLPVFITESGLSASVAVFQMQTEKGKIVSAGGKGLAPYSLQLDIAVDAARAML